MYPLRALNEKLLMSKFLFIIIYSSCGFSGSIRLVLALSSSWFIYYLRLSFDLSGNYIRGSAVVPNPVYPK